MDDPLRSERVSSGVGGESGLAWMSVVSNGSGGVAMVEIWTVSSLSRVIDCSTYYMKVGQFFRRRKVVVT